jgi:hypothetical protein
VRSIRCARGAGWAGKIPFCPMSPATELKGFNPLQAAVLDTRDGRVQRVGSFKKIFDVSL